MWQLRKQGVAAIVLAVGLAAPAHADSEVANAEITIVRPLSFVIDDNLDFGNVIRGTTAGTVTVAPNGARTSTGGVTLAAGGGHKAASFAGQGSNNQRVDVSLGSNSIIINGPGAPMRVHTFVIGSTPTAVLTTTPRRFRINSPSGVFNFPIGATLDVGANQAPGKYTGNWTITLNYF
ncbi:MAG TPA: DUF4402 domain-containing protein [Sphingorhabdus sp.]|nr:DUF4402 domain-containing protein [Sphingorhabdus sp.]